MHPLLKFAYGRLQTSCPNKIFLSRLVANHQDDGICVHAGKRRRFRGERHHGFEAKISDNPGPQRFGKNAFAGIRRHDKRQTASLFKHLQGTQQKVDVQPRPAIERTADQVPRERLEVRFGVGRHPVMTNVWRIGDNGRECSLKRRRHKITQADTAQISLGQAVAAGFC